MCQNIIIVHFHAGQSKITSILTRVPEICLKRMDFEKNKLINELLDIHRAIRRIDINNYVSYELNREQNHQSKCNKPLLVVS